MDLNTIQYNDTCINCLSNSSLKCYKLRNATLKSLFKTESLNVCYICTKIIYNTEEFIQNVYDNQKYLQNHQDITESDIQAKKLQSQPIITLSNWHNVLEINPDDFMEDETFVVYRTGNVEVPVKLEIKDEVLEIDYLDEDTPQESDLDTHIKEEDLPLPQLRKTNTKNLKKPKTKANEKKKNVKLNENYNFTTINKSTAEYIRFKLTKKQYMEERKKMANDPQFRSATYKCMDCIKWFLYLDGYEKHMVKHDKVNGEYKCDICKQRCESAHKLMHHRACHFIRYKCTVCDLTRCAYRTIRDHYVSNHASVAREHFTCEPCGKTFKQQGSLTKHIDYTHRNISPAQCDLCQKVYKSKGTLKAHLIRKHRSSLTGAQVPCRQHECPQCGKAFLAPSLLRLHMTVHSAARDHYCVECDKSFKSESALKQHYKIAAPHVDYKELPLACDLCQKRFYNRRNLDRHRNRVHLNLRPFQCDKCEKRYLTLWSLTDHKKRAHEGYKRPFNHHCPMCDKVFDRGSTMKMHVRTHTGERPYKCPKCPAEFGQAGVRSTHMKLVHLKLTRDGQPKGSAAVK